MSLTGQLYMKINMLLVLTQHYTKNQPIGSMLLTVYSVIFEVFIFVSTSNEFSTPQILKKYDIRSFHFKINIHATF